MSVSFGFHGPPLRPSNTGNNFSCNLSRNNAALQVEMVCCEYYHLLAQQIFMLQKVDVAYTFCNMKFVAQEGGNTRNKPSQLAQTDVPN